MLSQITYQELTSTKKLGSSGVKFRIWKSKIEFVLFELDVAYALTDPKPIEPTENFSKEEKETYKKWIKDDFTCRHIMLFAMEDDLFLYFDSYKNAKEMMDAITNRFVSTSMSHRLLLYKKLVNYRMSEEETNVMDHITKMAVMAGDLKEAGSKLTEESYAAILLISLPESWECAIRARMLMDDPNTVLTMNNVIKHLRMEEDLRALRSFREVEDEELGGGMRQKNNGRFKGKCFSCGKRGHSQYDCPDE